MKPPRLPSVALTLRVYCGGMRWTLGERDRVELYRGPTCVGTLTGRQVALLVEHPLLAAEVRDWLAPPAAPPALGPPRRPLAPVPSRHPFTATQRAAQRAQRRTRRQ